MSLPGAHSALHKAVACILYDERYRGWFLSLKSIAILCEMIAPEERVLNKNTMKYAFAISGADRLIYSYESSGVASALECPKKTLMVVRKVRRTGGSLQMIHCRIELH